MLHVGNIYLQGEKWPHSRGNVGKYSIHGAFGLYRCIPKTCVSEILLMAEILHQLRLVVYPIIDRVLYIPGGAGFQPSTVSLKIGGLLSLRP